MTPIERAARALCELAGNPPGATMDGKPLWQDYVPEVLAVITAIREPLLAICGKHEGAGERSDYDAGKYAAASGIWYDIDALLNETP